MEDNERGPLNPGPVTNALTTPQGRDLDSRCPEGLPVRRRLLAFQRGSERRLEALSIAETRVPSGKGWRALGLELRLATSGGPGHDLRLLLSWPQAQELARYLASHPKTREAEGPGGEA